MARSYKFTISRSGHIRAEQLNGATASEWQVYHPQSRYIGTLATRQMPRIITSDERLLNALFKSNR